MLKNFRDKIALSGVAVLMIGVALLIFTFISAYGFLTQSLSIIASDNLIRTFGETLAPLIGTCIRVMYLGVMGWIGSLLTVRGVTIIAHAPKEQKVFVRKRAEAVPKTVKSQKQEVKPQPQPPTPKKTVREAIPEEKPEEPRPKEAEPEKQLSEPEPEVIFIPPEEAAPPQVSQEQQRESSSSQPQSNA